VFEFIQVTHLFYSKGCQISQEYLSWSWAGHAFRPLEQKKRERWLG